MQNDRHQPELSPSSYPFGFEGEAAGGKSSSNLISDWPLQLDTPSQTSRSQELGLQSFDAAGYGIIQPYLPDFGLNTSGADTTGYAPCLNSHQIGNASGFSSNQQTLPASVLNGYHLRISLGNSGRDAHFVVPLPLWERTGNGTCEQLFSTASEDVGNSYGLDYMESFGENTRWNTIDTPKLATSRNSNWLSGFQSTGIGMDKVLFDFNNPNDYSEQVSLTSFNAPRVPFSGYQQQLHGLPTSSTAFEASGYRQDIIGFDFNDFETPLPPMSMNYIGQFPNHVNQTLNTATGISSFDTSTPMAIPPAAIPQPAQPAAVLAFACRHPPCVWSFKREHERNRHENSKHRHVPGAIVCPIQGCSKAVGRGWKRADKLTEHLWKVHGDLGYVKKG